MNLHDKIQPFYVMELLNRAKALEQAGADIVHMEIGEPDFPSPPLVVNAWIEFLFKGEVKYTPAAGLPSLREAIARFYAERYGIDVPASRIFVNPGASGAVLLALAGLLERGDEVLLSDPGYPCYPNFVRLLGGEPHLVLVGAESNFQLDAEMLRRYWTAKAQGVVMALPSKWSMAQLYEKSPNFSMHTAGFGCPTRFITGWCVRRTGPQRIQTSMHIAVNHVIMLLPII